MSHRKLAIMLAVAGLWTSLAAAQDLDNLMKIRPGQSRAVTSTDPSFTGNADRVKYIAPGETKVLADIAGPGVIRHIWLTFSEARPTWLEAGGSAAPDEIVLRMYWDGAKEPAVESPLGDFFGAGFGRRSELVSVPVQVETGGDGYNCFWPMPFCFEETGWPSEWLAQEAASRGPTVSGGVRPSRRLPPGAVQPG